MTKKRVKRILTSAERRKKIRRKRTMRLVGLCILLLFICIGIVSLLRIKYFKITDVSVQGATDAHTTEILTFINTTLSGNTWFVIPHNQILFYSSKTLADQISLTYPSIQKVEVTKKYMHGLQVHIIERSPDSLYCDTTCYFIDSTGFIYEAAPSFSPGVYTVFADSMRNASTSLLNTNYTDEKTYTILKNTIEAIKTFNSNQPLIPTKVTFIATREIKIEIQNNGYFLINLDRPFDETIENIKTALDQGLKNFQYIDVRYGNKIYYKIISDILTTSTTTQHGSTTIH